MTKKLALLVIILLGGIWSASAQSESRNPRLNPGSSLAMHAASGQSIRPEEYAIALPATAGAARSSTSDVLFKDYGATASLLLHLKNDQQRISLRVTNAVGNVVQNFSATTFAGGFYELPVLNHRSEAGIYVVKLVVDDRVVTFRTVK